MERGVVDLRDVLIVEDDEDIGLALEAFLTDEGYRTAIARTSEEAAALIEERAFNIILADILPSDGADILHAVDALRQSAFPTPVILVTAWRLDEAVATERGFCALVTKPFDVEDLLVTIAACLEQPLSAEQERQAEVVRRYFTALSAKDWDALAALCAQDVTYVLPGTSSFAHTITGRQAFRAFSQATFQQFPDSRFTGVAVYATPLGLAARYTGSWHAPDGTDIHQSGAVVFRFTGDQIAHIGIQLNAERLGQVTSQA